MLDAGFEVFEADDCEMVALDLEGVDAAAQYLHRARGVGLYEDRRVTTADVAQQRSHPYLGHTDIMPCRVTPGRGFGALGCHP